MPDAWRAYLDLALGLTEAPRKKAQQVAGELLNRGGATAAQVQGLVEDLLSAGIANREALTNIVRYEVDRALGRVGLATVDEVSELTTRVHDLERQLREAQARSGSAEAVGGTRLDKPAPAPSAPARKTVAKKAVKAKPNAMPAAGTVPAAVPGNAAPTSEPEADTTPVKAAPVKRVPAKRTPRKAASGPAAEVAETPAAVPSETPATSVAERAPAKKAAAERAPAKKAVAERAPAKKAAAERAPVRRAGTVAAPVSAVTEAAAATEVPPAPAPRKRAPRRAQVPTQSTPATENVGQTGTTEA
ncbi:hypothetical protein [Actinoplanes sp. NPDC049802]|uniref:phasin family protein n=1 Tax=Actinoplanes sp. NPDC049802 TaxID=3154742 RepID=UPI0033E7EE21